MKKNIEYQTWVNKACVSEKASIIAFSRDFPVVWATRKL